MRNCPHCGAEDLQEIAVICRHCGRDLKTGAPTGLGAPPVPTARAPVVTTRRCAVAFVPLLRDQRNASEEAAKQLNEAIAQWAAQGWAFVRLESLTTVIDNGCLASLFGSGKSVMTFQVAILERAE